MSNKNVLGDNLKIHQINTQIKIANSDGIDNFREFQRIYGPLFTKKSDSRKPMNSKCNLNVRPLIEVKTIQLEMPKFGSESAVINPRHKALQQLKPVPSRRKSKPLKTSVINTKEQCVVTSAHGLVKKLSQMEHLMKRNPTAEVHQTTSTIIDVTHKELEVATEQLNRIKKLIDLTQAKTQTKKPAKPTPKKKIIHSHRDCHKKHKDTLYSMQKKLKEIEKKYYKRPQVLYKNVNDSFTQFSRSVETIFHHNSLSENTKLDETLKAAISELEDIVNTDIPKKLQESPNFIKPEQILESTKSIENINLESVYTINKDAYDDMFKTLPISTPSVSPVQSVEKQEYLAKTILSKSVFPFHIDTPLPDYYSKALEDFFGGKELAEVSDSSDSSSSSITSKREQPKHVKIEHVLAKNWQGDDANSQKAKQEHIKEVSKVKENKPKNVVKTARKSPKEKTETKSFKNFIETIKPVNNVENENGSDLSLTHSFKKRQNIKETDNVSKVIDSSEKWLSKFRNLKQDVVDVNAFCDTLCSLLSDHEEECTLQSPTELPTYSQNIEKSITPCALPTCIQQNGNIFDETKVQESVMRSCYLMKEFNIKPKIFFEEDPVVYSKAKLYNFANICSASGDKNMNGLLENLQRALENSIYKVEPPDVFDKYFR